MLILQSREKKGQTWAGVLRTEGKMLHPLGGTWKALAPEAKSLGPNGKRCEFDTLGLLQRVHIVANSPPIYIGKESDKHWEEGEDLSLLEFKTIEYKRKGYAIATDEQLERIAKLPKREFRRRGINQHTLEKISGKAAVRAMKLAKCLKVLEEYEAGKAV